MKFPDGVLATLRMSRTSELKHFIRIQTAEAFIDLPTYSRDHFFVESNGTRQRVECRVAGGDEEHLWPARDQLIDFADAIESGRPPKVTGEEGARVIQLIEACYMAKKRRPLPKFAPVPGVLW